jgi:hypothetical protein
VELYERWGQARGRPPEAGSQVQVSNHCKLLSSKAMVVSVAAKGGIQSRQVWSGEASESKCAGRPARSRWCKSTAVKE